jgi:hypothetical protein
MKRDIPVTYVKQTPLDICLALWVRFLHRNDNKDCGGYKGRDSILKSDGLKDSEQLYDEQDMIEAEAVDACISSLKTYHAWAIKRRCNVATVWRFPQLNFSETLLAAEKELEEKLKKNLATRNYFA